VLITCFWVIKYFELGVSLLHEQTTSELSTVSKMRRLGKRGSYDQRWEPSLFCDVYEDSALKRTSYVGCEQLATDAVNIEAFTNYLDATLNGRHARLTVVRRMKMQTNPTPTAIPMFSGHTCLVW